MMQCEACGEEFINLWDSHNICMDCVKARHRACVNRGKCSCGKKRRVNPTIHQVGSRTWTSCDRCLGQVKQLS